ncbi:MAG TPA: hypothetical protein VFA46_04435 [Actinomycetes bacterium]|jgi:hypothetical protein|nr:hypothetical protein [Actinomycetes bacterium]
MDDSVEKFAVGVTRLLDRRSFLRKIAANTFKAAAVFAVGGTLVDFMATPAYANCGGSAGPGCPKVTDINGKTVSRGCGTSRCCNYLNGRPSSCNCASGTTCKTTSGYCYGRDYRYWGSSGCWSCTVVTKYDRSTGCYYGYTTTCCDCKTNASKCSDKNISGGYGRCIGWSSTYRKLGC